jgi:hypothetical protein
MNSGYARKPREERPSKEAAQDLRGFAFEGRSRAGSDDSDVGVLAFEVVQPPFDLRLLPGVVQGRYAVHPPTLVHAAVLRRRRVRAYRRCVKEHGNPSLLDGACRPHAPLDVVHPKLFRPRHHASEVDERQRRCEGAVDERAVYEDVYGHRVYSARSLCPLQPASPRGQL